MRDFVVTEPRWVQTRWDMRHLGRCQRQEKRVWCYSWYESCMCNPAVTLSLAFVWDLQKVHEKCVLWKNCTELPFNSTFLQTSKNLCREILRLNSGEYLFNYHLILFVSSWYSINAKNRCNRAQGWNPRIYGYFFSSLPPPLFIFLSSFWCNNKIFIYRGVTNFMYFISTTFIYIPVKGWLFHQIVWDNI